MAHVVHGIDKKLIVYKLRISVRDAQKCVGAQSGTTFPCNK